MVLCVTFPIVQSLLYKGDNKYYHAFFRACVDDLPIRDVYAEAKSFGFDTKALRQLIKIRKTARIEREEQEAILEAYLVALGEI